jgi:DNA-binding transcriptional ArsR family regulator
MQSYLGDMTQPTPERVYLNAQTLKGIAHPIRLRLLGLLREDGPSTATKLAERIGQSSGVTSYHLRQLAQFGFVEDAVEQGGGGRERWWKAAHRYTSLEAKDVREAPAEAEAYMRAIANAYADRMDRWLGEMPMLPSVWDEASTFSDFALRLTAAEATEFLAKITEMIQAQRADRADADAPDDAERVSVQLQVMPFLRAAVSPMVSTKTIAFGEKVGFSQAGQPEDTAGQPEDTAEQPEEAEDGR